MNLLDRVLGTNRDLTAAQAQAPTPYRGSAIPPASPWSPRDVLVHTTFAELFGTDTLIVDRTAGMNLGPLAKARNLLAVTGGGFPLVGMTGSKRTEKQPLICRQPEIGRARSTTVIWAFDSMFWYGRAWYLIRDRYAEDNRPSRVQWVPEWEADVDSMGLLVRAFGREVDQVDVIRVDGPNEGILNFAQPLIREAVAIAAASAKAADNPVPSIDLHQTGGTQLDDDAIDKLTARWIDSRRAKNGGVAYTSQSIEARVLGQNVEQLLIAAKQQSDLNLIRAAGLPAWAADIPVEGSSLTYSNVPSRSRELIDYGLQGYMTAFADRWSMDDIMPAGQWCRFDTTAVLQGDFKERMEGYEIAIRAGIYTEEQCRQIEAGIALEDIG